MSDSYCIITLKDGSQAIIDREDYDLVKHWKWQNVRGYAARIDKNCVPKSIKMHRLILEHHCINIKGLETDHCNGNKLDNRKANLRPVTRRQNSYNRGDFKHNTSGFKNVRWDVC